MSPSLIVFKVNQLGDSVAFLPTLQRLFATASKQPMPCPIHLWTTPVASSVLAFHPDLIIHQNTLKEYNGAWRNPLKALKYIRAVRDAKPKACLLDWDQGNMAHLAAFFSGASKLVGGINRNVRLNRYLGQRASSPHHSAVPQWCWEIGKRFAREVFDEEWEDTPPAPDLSHLLDRESTETKLNQPSIVEPRPIVIHPGASILIKRWPLERYLMLATELVKFHPVTIIQPQELEPITAPAGVRLISPANIRELTTVIANASLFIGNNSGPMNITFALGIPSVVFWGSSDPAWRAAWYPERHLSLSRKELPCLACDTIHLDNQCHHPQEPIACMRRWQVEEVFTACLDWHRKWSSLANNLHKVQ